MNILQGIIKASINKRKAVYLMIAIVFILAFMRYESTTKSLLPNAKFPYVSVYTYMAGASPSNMEGSVTNKIEKELNDLSDLEKMTSESSYSSSVVVLKFKEGAVIDEKIRLVQTKVQNMKHGLPEKAESPVVEEYDINNSPIILIEIDSRLPYADKKNILKDVERNVKSISGVSKILISGMEERRIEVVPDLQKLEAFGVSEIEVIEKIKSAKSTLPLGSIIMNGSKYNLQVESQLLDTQDIGNLIVRKSENRIVYVRDLCEVKWVSHNAGTPFKITKSEKTPTVLVSVFKRKSADTISINEEIVKFTKHYNENRDYGDILSTSVNVSKYISKSINDVLYNAFSGLLSVIVVLFFFIGFREALIASSVIPVTLLSSFLVFEHFDITLNIFSIMGLIIALGMLVDNAIVVIEMIDEKKKTSGQLSMTDIVVSSTTRVAPAILASTVTTVCALVPLAIMKGDIGSIIREIPLTAAIAMTISFITSVTVTPILAAQFIKHSSAANKYKALTLIVITVCALYAFSDNLQLTGLSFISGPLVAGLGYLKLYTNKKSKLPDLFHRFIGKLMHSKGHKILVMGVTVVLLISSVGLLFSDLVKKEAMPESDDVNQFARVRLIEGSVKEDLDQVSSAINAHMLKSNYVKKIIYYYNDASIHYTIELVDKRERDRHSKDIIREFNGFINGLPDVKGRFSADGEEGSGGPIRLRLIGSDHDTLNVAGQALVDRLRNIDGVLSPRIDFAYSRPTIDMKLIQNKCDLYGVSPLDVMLKLRYLTSGEEVATIESRGQDTDIYLKYYSPFDGVNDLKNITVQNEKGLNIPLLELVDIQNTRFSSVLKHYEGKPTISLVADKSSEANVNIIVKDLFNQVKEDDLLPQGVRLEPAGESEDMEKSFQDLTQKMMVASVLVYIVLVSQFNSYAQPFAIVLSIPYAVVGVVLGYLVFGLTFSTLSFLGIVALVGIAVNDAIVLIDYVNMLREKHGMDNIESIIEGCRSRLTPIIATSLTTISGVLPLAIYNEDYSGIAYSLIFGLVFSTFLTLVVVPITMNGIESIIDRMNKGVKVNV